MVKFIKKIYNFFKRLRCRWILWRCERLENKSFLTPEKTQKHWENIFYLWNFYQYFYEMLWEKKYGARPDGAQWFIFSEMCWEGDKLSIHFWHLLSMLFLFYFFYHFFYYKRRLFYEEKRKSSSYEKYKFELRIQIYGWQKTLLHYFELDKKILEIRAFLNIIEFFNYVVDILLFEVFDMAKKKDFFLPKEVEKILKDELKKILEINLKKNLNINTNVLIIPLYYSDIISILLTILETQNIDTLQKDKIKIFFYHPDVLDLVLRYEEIFNVCYTYNMDFCLKSILLLKKIYEEAYFLRNDVDMDIDFLKAKHGFLSFQENQLYFFAELKKNIEAAEALKKKLKEEEEADSI